MTSQLQQRVVANLVRRYDRPMMNNVHRGEYVECLVAEILSSDWELPWTIGHDWAPWDLEHSSGTRIEVKQSAALQPWHVGNSVRTSPRFDISPRNGYWTLDSSWIDRPGRSADIYVFGWRSESEESLADHRAPEQWTFFVVSDIELAGNAKEHRTCQSQETCRCTGYESLASAVQGNR